VVVAVVVAAVVLVKAVLVGATTLRISSQPKTVKKP
jgi:hypothetical protein